MSNYGGWIKSYNIKYYISKKQLLNQIYKIKKINSNFLNIVFDMVNNF